MLAHQNVHESYFTFGEGSLTMEQFNLEGIAKLEAFLDRIEDLNEQSLKSFQDDFIIVENSMERIINDKLNNKKETDLDKLVPEADRNKINIVTKERKWFDGSRECTYKGSFDFEGKPCGNGTLEYSNGDTFSGSFSQCIKNRTGVEFKASSEVKVIAGASLKCR